MTAALLAAALLAAPARAFRSDAEVFARVHAEPLEYQKGYVRLDPVAGLLHGPSLRREIPWPEHPRGRVVLQTNAQGLREDAPTPAVKRPGSYRVLVLGDSHVDGMVDNAETFPALLEAGLPGWDVVNAGVFHTSLREYVGALKTHLALRPDLVVVTVYAGNDFLEAARYLEAREGLSHDASYLRPLRRVEKVSPGAVWQALNQALYFRASPHMERRALLLAREAFVELRGLCRGSGAKLLVVLLPTKLEMEWESDRGRLGEIKRRLSLDESALRVNSDLREAAARELSRLGVRYLDASQAPPPAGPTRLPLFWATDYHLSSAGHRWLADALRPVLLALRRG